MSKSIKYLFYSFLIISFSSCGYNKLVDYEESVNQKWSVVATAYTERADAVADFLRSIKANATVDKKQLSELEKTLSAIESLDIPKESISPEAIDKFMKKQDELSNVLRNVMGESGIDNNAVNKFEAVHNKIRNARRKFNDSVSEYNTYKRQFPQNMTSGPMGFDNYEPLKVDEGSRKL